MMMVGRTKNFCAFFPPQQQFALPCLLGLSLSISFIQIMVEYLNLREISFDYLTSWNNIKQGISTLYKHSRLVEGKNSSNVNIGVIENPVYSSDVFNEHPEAIIISAVITTVTRPDGSPEIEEWALKRAQDFSELSDAIRYLDCPSTYIVIFNRVSARSRYNVIQ